AGSGAERDRLFTALRDTTPSQRGAVRELVAALRGEAGEQRLTAFLKRRDQRRHLRLLVAALAGLNGPELLGFLTEPVRVALNLEPESVPPRVWRDALGLFVLDVLDHVEAQEAATRPVAPEPPATSVVRTGTADTR